jgi:hypothetical protein
LLEQLGSAQFELATALAEMMRNGAPTDTAVAQLQSIGQLQRQVGNATPAALITLRGDIAAAVARAQAVTQAQGTGGGASAAEGATLANLAARVETQASSFMRDAHQSDSLLDFGGDARAEADYREREAERRRRYDAESAKGTPEGTLNAGGEALGQMADLAVHGGSTDPALMRRMDELAENTTALRDGMVREGRDVSAFDHRMREDLRAIMRSKGKSEAEIDALLAAHPDRPIDAIKAFVTDNAATFTARDLDALSIKVSESDTPATGTGIETPPPLPANTHDALSSVSAELRALGIGMAEHDPATDPAHGVSTVIAPSNRGTTLA